MVKGESSDAGGLSVTESNNFILTMCWLPLDENIDHSIYTYPIMSKFLMLWPILCAISFSPLVVDAEDDPEFPYPFSSRTLKISSESFGDDYVRRNDNKEFNDLTVGRAFYSTIQSSGFDVLLVHAKQDVAFSYQPYTCIACKQANASLPAAINRIDSQVKLDYSIPGSKKTESYNLSLFGITALWNYAYSNPDKRALNRSDTNYRWTVQYEPRNLSIDLIFIDVPHDKASDSTDLNLVLDTVQIYEVPHETIKTRLLTYNIYSVSTVASPDDIDMLQMPVGYGCLDKFNNYKWLDLPLDIKTKVMSPSINWFNWHYNTEFEIIATEFGSSMTTSISNDSCTATKSMEFVVPSDEVIYIKTSDSDYDQITKSVIDAKSGVRYNINLKMGSCKLERHEKQATHNPVESLRFVNGMKLDITLDLLDKLFQDNTSFKVVKISGMNEGNTLYTYEERTFQNLLGPDDYRLRRVIRSFTFDIKTSRKQLNSVAIWVLNDNKNFIDQSYLINLVRQESKLTIGSLDVSQDCFLNDNSKAYGRDYAWFRWHFTANERQLRISENFIDRMQLHFHESLKDALDLSWTRAPKFELIPDESGFTARLLVLESPDLHFIFTEYKGKRPRLGFCEHVNFAPDIEHCSKLCLDHQCRVFSFSSSTYQCNYTTKALQQSHIDTVIVQAIDCSTFILPDGIDVQTIQKRRLHWLISEARNEIHHSEGPQPDTYDIQEEVKQRTSKIHFMVGPSDQLSPDSFEVESDLDSVADFSDDNPAESFSVSISTSRYHTNDRELRQQIAMREYSDLDYDQCALVCLDSGFDCGSFSYCNHRKACVLTNLNNTNGAKGRDLLVEDHDCFIVQRDYLRSFHRIEGTSYPSSYLKEVQSTDRRKCAEQCLFSKDLQCLGFDFCLETKTEGIQSEDSIVGTCFYQQTRYIPKGEQLIGDNRRSVEAKRCDHYSRLSLADFSQSPFQKFIPAVWKRLTSSRYQGRTLTDCADLCALNTLNCIGFELCTEQTAKNMLIHTCTTVEGSLEDLMSVSNAENATQTVADRNIAIEFKLRGALEADINCRVLMLKERSRISIELPKVITDNQSDGGSADGGLSIFGAILLFITLTMTATAITFGLCSAKERSLMVRRCLSYPRSFMGSVRLFAR